MKEKGVKKVNKINLVKDGKNMGILEVKNLSNRKAELVIYGNIAATEFDKYEDEDIAPSDIKGLLESINGLDLDIYINSSGGNVFAGIAIYNMLKRHTGYKRIFIDGVAASIASVIAMVGDEINIPANSYIFIHKAWDVVSGNADNLREKAAIFDRLDKTLLSIYMTKVKEGIEEATIEKMMAETKWLNGFEAAQYFNVNTTESNQAVACLDEENCKLYRVPEGLLKNKIENVEKVKVEKIKTALLLEIA